MKIATTLIASQFLFTVHSIAQNLNHSADSVKYPLAQIKHDMRIPCQFAATFNKRENGQPFFCTNDSAQLEFSFFKLTGIPVYNPGQTITETAESFYKSILQRNDSVVPVSVAKITEDRTDPYFVYKVEDLSGEFYQLVAREGDLLYTIKIFSRDLPKEKLLEKLNLLYLVNKNQER